MRKMSSIPLFIFVVFGLLSASQAQLKHGFYEKSCPQAERIVQAFVNEHVRNAPPLAAALLRLHFHDCFVRGCDASLLLNSTKDNKAEKDSPPDMGMRGFDFIDAVKSKLEESCPGVVSCADVVALVARDAVVRIGGPHWNVPTGRRDGTVSLASETPTNIPPPTLSFSDLKDSFAKKNLNVKDLVMLSGAHTIGITTCSFVSKRLYNFTGKGDQDPTMDKFYAANLKKYKCKTPQEDTMLEMDPGSFTTFDTRYYTNVVKRRGLFTTDLALLTDGTARSYIDGILNGTIDFFKEFGLSMEKMGRIEVKTGTEGEIRKVCSLVNS